MATSLNLFELILTSSGLTTASTAYTAGDVLGAEMSGVITGATQALLIGAVLVDKAAVVGQVSLYIGDRTFALGTDNAAISITDANALFLTPTLYFPPPDSLVGSKVASVDSLAIPVKANASNTIFARMVTNTGHTFFAAATDIQVKLYFSLDV